jgi:hypothetical protein
MGARIIMVERIIMGLTIIVVEKDLFGGKGSLWREGSLWAGGGGWQESFVERRARISGGGGWGSDHYLGEGRGSWQGGRISGRARSWRWVRSLGEARIMQGKKNHKTTSVQRFQSRLGKEPWKYWKFL